tara:strand:- start:258 stop:938 length:681 start_codon:yes stop_codon:yes gene_type:complete
MASTYTPLGIEKMATGENAGTWGTKTNTNLEIIEQVAGGYTTQSIASTPTTLSVSDGSTGATLAHRIIEFTGTIGEATTVTIPIDVQDFYIIKNNSSGAYTVTFKYVSGSGSTVQWSATDKGTKIIYATANDGTNPDIVDVFATSSEITLANANALKLGDADTSAYVGLDAPSTVSGSYTITFPAAVASGSDYALTTSDSSGTMQWTATSTFGISIGKSIAMAMIF